MKRLALLGLTLALSTLSRHGAAAPLGATLVVERSERASDCPDAPALTAQVERILQRSLQGPAGSDELEVRVQFGWSREQYSASVLSRGPKPGERVLQDRGQSCAALAEAVSVTIALLLDKELAARASSSGERANEAANAAGTAKPAQVDAKSPSAGEATEADANRARQAREAARQSELRGALEAGAAFGLVGKPSAILSEQLGVRLQRHLILEAGFSAVLPATTKYEAGSVRTTLLFGTARACYVWGDRFSIGPCADFGVGRLQGAGIGYQTPATETVTWAAFAAGAVAEGPVWGRVFWGVSGAVWVPTVRSIFTVQNVGTAWESSRVAGSLGLRVGLRIW
jgi:hypothetical protein